MNRQANAKGERPKCVCCGETTEWKGNRKGYVCKNYKCDSRVFNYAHQQLVSQKKQTKGSNAYELRQGNQIWQRA